MITVHRGGAANLNVSAGTQSNNLASVVFSNSNGVSFGLNASTITASAAGGGGDAIRGVAAGGSTATTNTVNFSNSNGLSFGFGAGANSTVITGSYTTLQSLDDIIGVGTGNFSGFDTRYPRVDHIHRGLAGVGVSSVGNTAGNTGVTFGEYVWAGINNITLSQSKGPLGGTVTISGPNMLGISAGTQSVSTGTPVFSNSNGISFGMSGSSRITASHDGLTSQSNQAASGQNGSFTFQTLSFSNANGISIGTSAGPALTFSHNALTTAALSNHSHGNPQLNLTNLSGTTNSNSAGFTLSLSAAAPGAGGGIAASAAGNSVSSGTVVWSNSNNVSFGMAGSTITATAAGGAAAQPARRWAVPQGIRFGSLGLITNLTAITSRPFFIPWFHDAGDLTLSRVNWQMSRAATGVNSFTVQFGLYTYVNDTQISLVASDFGPFVNTATASQSGVRRFGMLITNPNLTTIPPRGYVMGWNFVLAGGNTSAINYSLMGINTLSAVVGGVLEGTDQYNTATSYNFFPFLGRLTGNSSVLPGSVADSQVIGQFTGASHFIQHWVGFNND